MKRLKKALALLVSAPVWVPVLLYMMVYVLIVDVDKVHKEFDNE
jgi:hypothetical protein